MIGSVEDIHAFIYCKKWRFGRVSRMPDGRTHSQTLKDRATQLLIKFKTGALVTQLTHRWVCEAFVPAEGFGRTSKVLISITTISINELSPYRSSPPGATLWRFLMLMGLCFTLYLMLVRRCCLFYCFFDVGGLFSYLRTFAKTTMDVSKETPTACPNSSILWSGSVFPWASRPGHDWNFLKPTWWGTEVVLLQKNTRDPSPLVSLVSWSQQLSLPKLLNGKNQFWSGGWLLCIKIDYYA